MGARGSVAGAVLVLALVLGACGGGSGAGGSGGAASGGAAVDAPDGDDARLDVVDQLAQISTTADEWLDAGGGESLVVGDGVRTDRVGFAQVVYPDGSLTRLGPRTAMTVRELATEAPTVVAVSVDVGQTWHNVRDLGDGGRFEVETSVATAAVRGTVFAVDCVVQDVCRFAVVEGEVEVAAGDDVVVLSAGQEVAVTPDGPGEVAEPGVDALLDDPWVARNTALDQGEDDPGAPAESAAARPVTVPARNVDGTATFIAPATPGDEEGVITDASVTVVLDPAQVRWVAWNDVPGLDRRFPELTDELVFGPGSFGVNDTMRVTLTTPSGETVTAEVDFNGADSRSSGPQNLLFGDPADAPDTVRQPIGLAPRLIDDVPAFEMDLLGEPGAYTFRFEFIALYGGAGFHPNAWLVVATG